MRKKYPFRSLTEIAGWLKKVCERCSKDFWVIPSQPKLRYCTDECRFPSWQDRLWASVIKGEKLEDCWKCKLKANADSYPIMKRDGDEKRVSRLRWEVQHGLIPDGLVVRHTCDRAWCVNPDHLIIGTVQDNIQDCIKRGRRPSREGDKCPTSKLNEAQARDIKFNPEGLTGQQLAAKHNISEPQVSAIRTGRQWKHLKEMIDTTQPHVVVLPTSPT